MSLAPECNPDGRRSRRFDSDRWNIFIFFKRFDMGAYSGAKRVQTIYTLRNHIKGSLMNLLNTRVYLSVVASGAKRWYSRQIRDLKDIAFLCKSFARKQFHFVVSWHF